MKNMKRIISVKIKRVTDESPDTSYLGEYSDTRTSEFSIDRAHSEDCASVSETARLAAEKLVRVYDYLAKLEPGIESAETLYEACNIIDELQTYAQECDCDERGDMRRNEYRYFNPSFNYVDKAGNARDTPENVRKYTRQDYERMERLNAGDWCYIGIRAEAEIVIGGNAGPIAFTQTIRSGGLWGIETNSDESYLAEVSEEQLSELRAQLSAIGFSKRAISQAFKSIEEVSE